MAPNLFNMAKSATKPWTWFKIETPNTPTDLHFSKSPVPGIYTTSMKGERYLVALKPTQGEDIESLFRSPNCNNNNNYNTSTSSLLTNKHESRSSRSSSRSGSTIRLTSSCSTNIHGTGIYTSTKTIHSIECILGQENTCGLRRLKTSTTSPNRSSISLSSVLSAHSLDLGIGKIDINGYKFLFHPVKTVYSMLLGRWMFSKELDARTLIFGNEKYFLLDDGVSWVRIGEGDKRGRVRERKVMRKGLKLRTEVLYEFGEKMEGQSMEKMCWNRLVLMGMDERILIAVGKETEDWVRVVRYLKGKR